MTTHVFVIGLDDFNRRQLQTIRGADQCAFHNLLPYEMVVDPEEYPIEEMIERGRRELAEAGVPVDAIIGHWDFPTTALLAIFRRDHGLPGPSLAANLIAEHKYWSRLRQQRVIPDHIPAFQSLDPFDPQAEGRVELDFPFWIKPAIGFSSQMVYRVADARELHIALEGLRRGIRRFGAPFAHLLELAPLPDDIPRQVDAHYCVLEKPIGGWQCTLEGYIQQGKVTVYGTVDSIRGGPLGSSLLRYEFPSELPDGVRARMVEITERTIPALELDNTPFNVEYFWDRETDRIWLLEVNSRISKSHCPLFVDVCGASHHEVAVDIAMGHRPEFPRWEGRYRASTKFMLRRFEDGVVTRVPSAAELAALEAEFPGTRILMEVGEGDRLSELRGQEVYSYEVGVIFMGGNDHRELEARYRELVARLPLEFGPPPRSIREGGRH
ncbi:ATP-grasp domain-containing protein [Microbulbifer yueqingensis]|uniref:ATP-grasp domain-containing protein n=1 Tax=Microbulbifer yueqingensis TaxID=658219 RepID=A0A1G8VFS6_9GAMM|nr:ATP-grasp domain-containing protein [Microbulbifer yueqingensis]SDJ64757.1 ATP-grasp domain-containing protein [Microbulbifer yueqingensis]